MPGKILALVGGEQLPTTATAAAHLIGSALKHLRKTKHLTLVQVAGKVPGVGSAPTLSRYENGKVKQIDGNVVAALFRYYGAGDDLVEESEFLVEMSHNREWWASYPDVVNDMMAHMVSLEAVSKAIHTYHEIQFPGMLQTAPYARSIMESIYLTAPDEMTRRRNEQLVERRLRVRLQRQHLLDQPDAPLYHALGSESVLRKTVGGPLVMREQLRHVYNLAENKPDVHIRVLPWTEMGDCTALHPAMTLFKPHSRDDGVRMVYLENTNRNGEFVIEPAEAEPYQASLDKLWTRAGTKDDTLALLTEYIDRLSG